MKEKVSISIKIVAYVFLLTGLLTPLLLYDILTIDKDVPHMLLGVKIGHPLSVGFATIQGIISLGLFWFLLKRKRWAYILAILQMVTTLPVIFLAPEINTKMIFADAFWAAILILLIIGRKDFKKI